MQNADLDSVIRNLQSAFKWSLRLVLRQRLLVFSEALICLSYSGVLAHGEHCPAKPKSKAGLPSRSLGERLVVRRGNAPRSLAYQASALLLSYRTVRADGNQWEAPRWSASRFVG